MFTVCYLGYNWWIAGLIFCVGRALLVGSCNGFYCGLEWLAWGRELATYSGVGGVLLCSLKMFYVF